MIKLQFFSPDHTLEILVHAVNLPTQKGRQGIFAEAAPRVLRLVAGIVEGYQVADDPHPKRWMIASGMGHIRAAQEQTYCIITTGHVEPVDGITHS